MCFSIEKNDDIFSYRERNCTERLPFICKQHIGELSKLFGWQITNIKLESQIVS